MDNCESILIDDISEKNTCDIAIFKKNFPIKKLKRIIKIKPNFLVGIINPSDNEKERLNPQNGICLSVLADACFEKGFITIDSDYKVRVSDQAEKDPALYNEISKYDGVKINLPKIKENRPAKRFLLEHQNRVS